MTHRTRAIIVGLLFLVAYWFVWWLLQPEPERMQPTPAEKAAIRAAEKKYGPCLVREANGEIWVIGGRIRVL